MTVTVETGSDTFPRPKASQATVSETDNMWADSDNIVTTHPYRSIQPEIPLGKGLDKLDRREVSRIVRWSDMFGSAAVYRCRDRPPVSGNPSDFRAITRNRPCFPPAVTDVEIVVPHRKRCPNSGVSTSSTHCAPSHRLGQCRDPAGSISRSATPDPPREAEITASRLLARVPGEPS